MKCDVRRFAAMMMAVTVMVTAMPWMGIGVLAKEGEEDDDGRKTVSYVYYESEEAAISGNRSAGQQKCTVVERDTATWNEGWYAVEGYCGISDRISVNGEVHLILCDGAYLEALSGIRVSGAGNSLTIYGQSSGTGRLNVSFQNSWYCGAGIGGDSDVNSLDPGEDGGTLTVHGGIVFARGRNGAGIGGGLGGTHGPGGDGGDVRIYGGKVTAYGKNGAGIGGGCGHLSTGGGSGGTVRVYGGTVEAYGEYASGIGGGGGGGGSGNGGDGGNVTISGGTVLAVGHDNGAGIGGGGGGGGSGNGGDGGSVSIGGGTVLAVGGTSEAVGIGGGKGDSDTGNGSLTVSGAILNRYYKDASGSWTQGGEPGQYMMIAAPADYSDNGAGGSVSLYNPVTDGDESWYGSTKSWDGSDNGGWYVVTGQMEMRARIKVTGDVKLLLLDGAKLTAKRGITVNGEGNSLTIYGQKEGTGTLLAGTADGSDTTCDDNYAGIGSEPENGTGGAVTIYGGKITAVGGEGAAGIDCSVVNHVRGFGWELLDESGQSTLIEADTEGSVPGGYKRVSFPVFKLDYDGNGAAEGNMTGSHYALMGGEVRTADNEFSRRGWTFLGWNTKASPTEGEPGISYENGADIRLLADTTLYARWRKNRFTLPDISNRVYSGSPLTLAVSDEATGEVLTEGKDHTLSVKRDGKAESQIRDAGDYVVTVSGILSGNYCEAASVTKSFTITKADSKVAAPTAKKLSYTGEMQELVNAGSASGGTLYYAVTSGADTAPEADDYLEQIPARTEAGTYCVWYKALGDGNHFDTAPAYVSVTIEESRPSEDSSSVRPSEDSSSARPSEDSSSVRPSEDSSSVRPSEDSSSVRPSEDSSSSVRPSEDSSNSVRPSEDSSSARPSEDSSSSRPAGDSSSARHSGDSASDKSTDSSSSGKPSEDPGTKDDSSGSAKTHEDPGSAKTVHEEIPGVKITAGGQEIDIAVTMDYVSEVEYTGAKLTPQDLAAAVDTSALESAAKAAAGKEADYSVLFIPTVKVGGRGDAGDLTFTVKIKLDKRKAKQLGMSSEDIKTLSKAVKELNKELKKNPHKVRVNKADLAKCFESIDASFDSKGKLKIRRISVKLSDRSITLKKKDYKVISSDSEKGLVTLEGCKNYEGTITVETGAGSQPPA